MGRFGFCNRTASIANPAGDALALARTCDAAKPFACLLSAGESAGVVEFYWESPFAHLRTCQQSDKTVIEPVFPSFAQKTPSRRQEEFCVGERGCNLLAGQYFCQSCSTYLLCAFSLSPVQTYLSVVQTPVSHQYPDRKTQCLSLDKVLGFVHGLVVSGDLTFCSDAGSSVPSGLRSGHKTGGSPLMEVVCGQVPLGFYI